MSDEHKAIRDEFHAVVNMPPVQLRDWLAGEQSRSVGMTEDGRSVRAPEDGEAVGHRMGERILELKARRLAELTEDDYQTMRKVIGYVHRHIRQRPGGDVSDTRWRWSLMNWGHDPLRD